ncbi:CLUMA_CG014572, isoform A [Clunio marinus]|uniref:CLUMA_CG014572, isoform A n=1 Tax=Clunio marinus TaxID=568069 RepID=A0A1J1INP1_9DIPT|nr:CLUMA_CG014572, isoform A [Clunio marinus]
MMLIWIFNSTIQLRKRMRKSNVCLEHMEKIFPPEDLRMSIGIGSLITMLINYCIHRVVDDFRQIITIKKRLNVNSKVLGKVNESTSLSRTENKLKLIGIFKIK